jgi:hypothetical protein
MWPVVILKSPGQHKPEDGQDDAQVQEEVGSDYPAGEGELKDKIQDHQHDPEQRQQTLAGGKEDGCLVDDF